MGILKKSDLKAMSAKEAEAKIADLEKAILEMHGEGKREKIAPLKKAIAQLKTKLASAPAAEEKKKETEGKKGYFAEFGNLRECPREFWVINLINLLDSLGYFAIIFIMALFFTQSLNIPDDDSQFIVGGYLAGITLVTFFVGFIVDSLGIKRSLLLGLGFVSLGRGLLSWLGIDWLGMSEGAEFDRYTILYTYLGILSFGQAFIQRLYFPLR